MSEDSMVANRVENRLENELMQTAIRIEKLYKKDDLCKETLAKAEKMLALLNERITRLHKITGTL